MITDMEVEATAEQNESRKKGYKFEPVWTSIIVKGAAHVCALYGLLLLPSTKVATLAFAAAVLYPMSFLGVTAGAHRLWAHKSYKASAPLRVILVMFNSMAFQKSVLWWCRDHRSHHKYSDTEADPHNINNGFFFAHIGWLLRKKHPEVVLKGRSIDMSDLEGDPILAFQHKYYLGLVFFFCYMIPTAIPYYFWGETITNAFIVAGLLRHLTVCHITFLVNSAAHSLNYKPYDKSMRASHVPSLSVMTLGEGWHNYHHCFPWDYKTSEFGRYSTNLTAAFIDLMAKIGWAYDLRTASPAVIERRVEKTGQKALRGGS